MNLPTNRSSAKESNQNYYFTGNSCVKGHVARRKTSNGECCECARIYRATYGKELRKKATLKWRANNPDKVKIHKQTEYLNNRDKYLEQASQWASENWDTAKEAKRRWSKANRSYGAMKRRERAAKERQAMPFWSDQQYILDVYQNCREFNCILNANGIDIVYSVDHIVPLNSLEVCGLHCEFNLQILTSQANSSKNNRHIETTYEYGT